MKLNIFFHKYLLGQWKFYFLKFETNCAAEKETSIHADKFSGELLQAAEKLALNFKVRIKLSNSKTTGPGVQELQQKSYHMRSKT